MLNQIQSPVSTSLHLHSLSFTNNGCSLSPLSLSLRNGRCATTALAVSRRAGKKKRDEEAKGKIGEDGEKFVEILTNLAESSGMSARQRRLVKVREAKRLREHERTHNYPQWAKVRSCLCSDYWENKFVVIFFHKRLKKVGTRILEDGCKIDPELRAILGDSIGNPELMKQRFLERVRKKGRDFGKKETGSVVAFKVSFRNFNPLDSHIWIELYGEASDCDVDLLGSVIQSWYVMGRLGAFNSSNLQLVDEPMSYDPLYDSEKASKVMPSSFHDIGDIEFQDSWARFWVDLGTADFFALDVLLNCLTVLSADHLGIKQVVFGGRQIGDWEEGMTNPQFGYKSYKI